MAAESGDAVAERPPKTEDKQPQEQATKVDTGSPAVKQNAALSVSLNTSFLSPCSMVNKVDRTNLYHSL